MTPLDRVSNITYLRIALYGLFVAYPFVTLRNAFVESPNPLVSLANFLIMVALAAGLVAVISLSHVFGYVSFLAVFFAELLYNLPLLFFTTHLAVALVFSEGVSALNLYQSVSSKIRHGANENATTNLRASLRLFESRFLLVGLCLVAVSLTYGVLPDILPFTSGLASLAVYVTISIIAIALTALYLGDRE